MKRIATIPAVAERHLCCGCGACAGLAPDQLEMVDVADQGLRPVLRPGVAPEATADLVPVCPGVSIGHAPGAEDGGHIPELFEAWGPILELWEGYATDPELRRAGSSGGAATALGLWALDQDEAGAVAHIRARPDEPWRNETVLSTTRDALLGATGSRYAPASPADSLGAVAAAPEPSVFIGKPCDVAAAANARVARPDLDRQLALTIAIFCAGTPSTEGTLEMMRTMGVDPDGDDVRSVRYRGNGWPGLAEVVVGSESGGTDARTLTYAESWGDILQRHRPWRCHICADHTGEFADVAVGDPWYREIEPDDPGRSLVLVRTERGRRAVRAAMEAGVLELAPRSPDTLVRSQPNLLRTRGAVWARLATMRVLGLPTPRYRNMAMFPLWRRELSVKQKAQSLGGTVKRIWRRRLHRPAS